MTPRCLSAAALCFIMIMNFQLLPAEGNFQVQVTIHSFSNPHGMCADDACEMITGCCEGSCPDSCEYYFSLCLRPAGTPVSNVTNENQGGPECSAIRTGSETVMDGASFDESVFNTTNPITFNITEWPTEGVQLYIELIDDDSTGTLNIGSEDELIDQFAVPISVSLRTSERRNISGIFGFATVDLTFRLSCLPDYIGPNCDVFCTDETTENCTCPPGFTGLFCDTDIDDCVGVDCGENQRCVDDLLNYTCVCEPGFTGPDCLTNIDNCALVNCNSGTCVDGVNFHICLCPPRFTGPSCETELDSYVLQFIIHSFSNPNGSCADVHCFDVEEQICCEENGCPSACDYYFSLCLREEVKFVSRMGENNLGGCPNIYTPAERVNEGAAFGQAIFGIETQFNFTGRVWPTNTSQLYIELVDSDGSGNFPEHELIDRFSLSIDTSITAGAPRIQSTITGIFNLAEIELSYTLTCLDFFFGPNCSTFCDADDCTSPPDFTVSTMTTNETSTTEMAREIGTANGELETIAAGVITAAVITATSAAILILIVIVVIRMKRKSKLGKSKSSSDDHEFTSLDVMTQSKNATECDLSSFLTVKNSLKKYVSECTIIDRCNLKLEESVGQGEYGIVYKGRMTSAGDRMISQVVAVKTLKGFMDESLVKELILECKKMSTFDHPNVLGVLGVCLDGGPAPFIIMPFMFNGSLLSYLKKHRDDLVLPPKEETDGGVAAKLVSMCYQVAKGMEYLASQKVVHRDLAARNCMIDMNFVIKVADFGLSETINPAKDYLRLDNNEGMKLPVKWLAPECINDWVFSEKSDVWAFGVTCWEVFSGGKIPYPGVNTKEIPALLQNGHKMAKPVNSACEDKMFDFVSKCWEDQAADRPTFSDTVAFLSQYLEECSGYTQLFSKETAESV